MNKKYQLSLLVPYYIEGKTVFVYIQRRDKDDETSPDNFGLFGGNVEAGETVEVALLREIKEELDYVPSGYKYLGKYEHPSAPGQEKFVYYLHVDEDFENKVTVLEGQYGRWFDEAEALSEQKLSERSKIILRDLFKKVKTT